MRSNWLQRKRLKQIMPQSVFTFPTAVNHVALNASGTSLGGLLTQMISLLSILKKKEFILLRYPTFRYATFNYCIKTDGTLVAAHPKAVSYFDVQGIMRLWSNLLITSCMLHLFQEVANGSCLNQKRMVNISLF